METVKQSGPWISLGTHGSLVVIWFPVVLKPKFFTFVAGVSSSIDGFVCLFVCVSVTSFYYVTIAGSSWHLYQTSILWNACCTYNFKSKCPGLRGHAKLLSCPLRRSMPIQRICFILGINIVHDRVMCRDPFPGQNVKGQVHTGHLKWRSHRLFDIFAVSARGSAPIWLNHFICSIQTTPEKTMCRALFSGWQVNGQSHTGRSNFLPSAL